MRLEDSLTDCGNSFAVRDEYIDRRRMPDADPGENLLGMGLEMSMDGLAARRVRSVQG